MTDHPITPPPELVQQWRKSGPADAAANNAYERHIATQAARWGSDQELEACIQYFHEYDPSWGEDSELIAGLRAARRPRPPSLKDKALKALRTIERGLGRPEDTETVRRALEQLDD